MTIIFTREELRRRLVRYSELRPCTTAFIDTRTPGSERKENFTIIGPGVAENPDQFVHIDIPHGFNIGGARQPPGCINSQHSHGTAEVFVVHTGTWRFKTGEWGTDGHVDLEPGDVISIPTHVFRGFENIGSDLGFMFAVLGGDNPGRVTWAPYVFEAARRHGMVLLEGGRLVDTQRERLSPDAKIVEPTTPAEAARLDRYDSAAISACVLRSSEFAGAGGLSSIAGFAECPIVGIESRIEGMPAGRMGWKHGFHVRALKIDFGARTPLHQRTEEEVVLIHEGTLNVSWPDGDFTLYPGDTFTAPIGMSRIYSNTGSTPALAYFVRGGDHPKPAQWLSPEA
jgi:mannose-6-phosphate isomerase-like protein (cupin superfamily)